jgi:hypothetical protein
LFQWRGEQSSGRNYAEQAAGFIRDVEINDLLPDYLMPNGMQRLFDGPLLAQGIEVFARDTEDGFLEV